MAGVKSQTAIASGDKIFAKHNGQSMVGISGDKSSIQALYMPRCCQQVHSTVVMNQQLVMCLLGLVARYFVRKQLLVIGYYFGRMERELFWFVLKDYNFGELLGRKI